MLTRLLPHFALLTAMLVWSTSFVALKIGLAAYSPFELMALRMTFATLMFAPYIPQLVRSLKKYRRFGALALMLACEPCLYFVFETQALRYTSASQAGMICAILPILVALGAWIALNERPTIHAWIGFALATFGVCRLSLDAVSTEAAPNPLLGNCFELAAMMCAAVFTICLKRLSTNYSPFHLTGLQAMAGMLFFVPQALFVPNGAPITLAVDTPSWLPFASCVYLGTCVTLGGYGLYNYGVSRIPAGQASAYINLLPVMTLAWGVLFLQEIFVPTQYISSALVIAGVILSQKGKHRS